MGVNAAPCGWGRDLELREHGLLEEDLLLLDDELLLELLDEGNGCLGGEVLLLGEEELADEVLELKGPAVGLWWEESGRPDTGGGWGRSLSGGDGAVLVHVPEVGAVQEGEGGENRVALVLRRQIGVVGGVQDGGDHVQERHTPSRRRRSLTFPTECGSGGVEGGGSPGFGGSVGGVRGGV